MFDGKEIDHKDTISLFSGCTRNISEGPAKKFWVTLSPHLPPQTKKACAIKFKMRDLSTMQCINDRPIRGEFKTWIWKIYLALSLDFLSMVDLIPDKVISKILNKITKFIKRWLNLPRCCTLVSVLHPDVLNIPFLPQVKEETKLSLLTAITQSKDILIIECLALPDFLSCNDFPPDGMPLLEAARKSTTEASSISKGTFNSHMKVTRMIVLINFESSLTSKTLWLLSLFHTPGIAF